MRVFYSVAPFIRHGNAPRETLLKLRRTPVAFAVVSLLAAGWAALAAHRFHHRARQVQTTARMTQIVNLVLDFEKRTRRLPTPDELAAECAATSRGPSFVDSWGSPFLYVLSVERGYVLASTGRDGKADALDMTVWFGRRGPAVRVHGVFDADLVAVNGQWVTVAGK